MQQRPDGYVPLWCKSNFSFLEGAGHPGELVDACHRLGLPAIALCDRDGVYGMVKAWQRARELGIKLITGSEVTVDDGSTLLLLAVDRGGYANLCRLITRGRLRSPKGSSSVSWQEIAEHAQGMLALWGGPRSLLTAEAEPVHPQRLLAEAFGERLYAILARHQEAPEVEANARLLTRAQRWQLPVVSASEVLYALPERRRLHDVVTCIRHGTTLSAAGRLTRPNDCHALLGPRDFARLYGEDLQAVARTHQIAELCSFDPSQLCYRYPDHRLPDGRTAMQHLEQLTLSGAARRYRGDVPTAVTAQLKKELLIINELDYPGYFLTMHEIVEFCREHGILCQGRGSAANSAVCFCLGITAVDPTRSDLLFERFLSRERAEPPDIDLDIEHDRREEVIQHVYRSYGRSHAAMVANVVRYRARSAVRDVGKALGLPETSTDRLARVLSHRSCVEKADLSAAALDPELTIHRHLLTLSNEILDFPRHMSIHPGGFLLGYEPVHDLVPIENASMEARTVIQWSKDDIEALGLFKVDLLGLGALNMLHRAFDLLDQHEDLQLEMSDIPADDTATFDMLCRGDTVGVFQVESRAQMAMLPRLRPRCFYDLVIEISIVRPGPITGGMVHPYLARRSGREPVVYPHPCLEPVLSKTLGVPLFQEQVMRLAVVAADYSPGEADQLRRDMAAWRHAGRIERHRDRLVTRMMARGITREFAERVFEQIRGFGEYGFPESHAASFALLAWATSWLKCHHPAVFACALLNAQPMGFYSTATIVNDARRHEVKVLPLDVSVSERDCTLEKFLRGSSRGNGDGVAGRAAVGDDGSHGELCLRMGLRTLRSLPGALADTIVRERESRGFESLEDFVRRSRVDDRSASALARAGALDCFGLNRRQSLWQVAALVLERDDSLNMQVAEALPAFAGLDRGTAIAWDHEVASHSARGHPLEDLRGELREAGLPDAASLNAMADGTRTAYAGLVTCRQRPATAGGVVFMTLEDETGFVNLVVWQRVFEQHHALLKTTSFLGVTGRVQSEDGVVHLLVENPWVPGLSRSPRPVTSRDFH